MSYSIKRETFEDAVADLIAQFRAQNPGISNIRMEYLDATVSIVIPKKPRPPKKLQVGPTVTTVGGFLP